MTEQQRIAKRMIDQLIRAGEVNATAGSLPPEEATMARKFVRYSTLLAMLMFVYEGHPVALEDRFKHSATRTTMDLEVRFLQKELIVAGWI